MTLIDGAEREPQQQGPTEVISFGHLRIGFDERVLRPRPWTVAQSEWAAELMATAPSGDVLELCAGAGHIGLLSVSRNDRRLVCVDLDPAAVGFARSNSRAAGLGDRVEVREGRLDEVVGVGESFSVVIADPPWVRRTETGRFPEDPLVAIDGGDDGLDVARSCLEVVRTHLVPGGSAVLQLGSVDQVHQLSTWAQHRGPLRATESRVFPGGGALVRFERATD